MKYEKKNNIGVLLMIGGTILLLVSLFLFSQVFLILGIVVAVGMLGAGLYLMTRGFSDIDQDHPDYNRYQQMKAEERKRRQQQ